MLRHSTVLSRYLWCPWSQVPCGIKGSQSPRVYNGRQGKNLKCQTTSTLQPCGVFQQCHFSVPLIPPLLQFSLVCRKNLEIHGLPTKVKELPLQKVCFFFSFALLPLLGTPKTICMRNILFLKGKTLMIFGPNNLSCPCDFH